MLKISFALYCVKLTVIRALSCTAPHQVKSIKSAPQIIGATVTMMAMTTIDGGWSLV